MMELISLVFEFVLMVMVLFLGFDFMAESFSEKSFFPDELVLPATVTRPIGLVLSIGAALAIVWQLIHL
ncbi:MAG: hypothetical protein DRJ14_09135 [Acidobacteria bacterium]|nr:MAG: hypothetical protein DRJ14_09135 [Acidobacteriota bacterium]